MVIYLDTGDLGKMAQWIPEVAGVTTNPSLLKSSGINDYKSFAQEALKIASGKPISFEVFADDLVGMETQAREISSWGENVYVKIPVSTTQGLGTGLLVSKLGRRGVKVNVTAVLSFEQISAMTRYIWVGTPAILSIFCGRIADTGRDPIGFITKSLQQKHHKTQVLWASAREVFNVHQARACGADIITLSPELLGKMRLFGKDLNEYSLDTVKQFYKDSRGIAF